MLRFRWMMRRLWMRWGKPACQPASQPASQPSQQELLLGWPSFVVCRAVPCCAVSPCALRRLPHIYLL
jgi:hypothetical protein